jgi:hypothetical protein
MPAVYYSCVVDSDPKFVYQLWIWITTLAAQGVRSSDLFVHIVRREGAQTALEAYLQSRGIAYRYIEPFGDGRFCNKLEQLCTPALLEREFAVLSDLDQAFLTDLRPWIGRGTICAKEVDYANPRVEALEALYRHAGFTRFPDRKRCTFDADETFVTNCNGGIYIFRTAVFERLLPRWRHWVHWVLRQHDILGEKILHVSQISLSLALWELGEPVVPLPRIANFPTHVPPELYDRHSDVPLVLHYHDRIEPDGRLSPVGVPIVDRSIDEVNALLARTERPALFEGALRAAVHGVGAAAG